MSMNHSTIDNYHALDGIPAMTSPQVHAYLTELGKTWTGEGVAMELGCWMGASSIALLKGLTQVGYNKPYWAFDQWRATKDQIPKAAAQGVKLTLGVDVQRFFLKNIHPVYQKIEAHRGGLPGTLDKYDKQPIEFCLFDAPKADPIFTMCIERVKPYWIPGTTVLGLLDYHFYLRHRGEKRRKFRAPVDFIEKWGRHFKVEKQWENECVVFFRYMEKF